VERAYVYRIVQRRAPLTRDAGFAWRVGHALDLDTMRAAAAHLVGRHDFTTFRSSICQADSPVRTLDALEIVAAPTVGGVEIAFHLRARSFLHNQVRSLVGTLERVGAGAWPPVRVADALVARDRAACGPVAPPDGLTLTAVRYPVDPFA
jgi:tRNA pseudouridine38-40 synthase